MEQIDGVTYYNEIGDDIYSEAELEKMELKIEIENLLEKLNELELKLLKLL